MAKRKSINKRLSRYSRNSTGSAILNPDTDIFDDEQVHWWKPLENNTTLRPSLSSNFGNQTSPHLNADSQIDTELAKDNWWNMLEETNDSNSKSDMDNRKKDSINNVKYTSESDEEPKVLKRKLPLRLRGRRSHSNAFLNALNSSGVSGVSTSLKKIERQSVLDDPIPNKSCSDQNKQPESIQESSSNQNESVDDVQKLKPKIYKKRHKSQHNIFDDILKDVSVESPLRRKSRRLFSSTNAQISAQHKDTAASELSINNKVKANQLVSSFSSDTDSLLYPVPKAQSTVLESGHLPSQNSSKISINTSENRVLKSKIQFVQRQRKNTTDNPFENILDNEKNSTNEKEIPAKNSRKYSEVNPNNTETSDIVPSAKIGSFKTVSEQNVKESIENGASDGISVVTNDSSDLSANIPKAKSIFATRPNVNSDSNIFLDILKEKENDSSGLETDDESNNIRMQRVPVSNTASRNNSGAKAERSHVLNNHSGKKSISRDEDQSTFDRSNRQTIRSYKKDTAVLERRSQSSESDEIRHSSGKQSKNTILQNKSTSRGVISESVTNVDQITPEAQIRTSTFQRKSLTRSFEESDVDEIPETLIKQTRKSTLQNESILSDNSDAEPNNVETTSHKQSTEAVAEVLSPSKRPGRQPNKSREQSNSEKQLTEFVVNDIEPTQISSSLKNQRKHLSKSREHSTELLANSSAPLRVQSFHQEPNRNLNTSDSDSNSEYVPSSKSRKSKNLTTSRKHLSLPAASESRSKNVSKKQGTSLNKSQVELDLPVVEKVEVHETNDVAKKKIKDLRKSHKTSEFSEVDTEVKERRSDLNEFRRQSNLLVTSNLESKELSRTSNEKSRSLEVSKKRVTTRIMSSSESEDEPVLKPQNKVLSDSRKLSVANNDSESKNKRRVEEQSKRLSYSQNMPDAFNEEDSVAKRKVKLNKESINLSSTRKKSAVPNDGEYELADNRTLRSQSKRFSTSKKLSVSFNDKASESESEATLKKQSKNLSSTRKKSAVPNDGEYELADNRILRNQSKRYSTSKKLSVSFNDKASESESEATLKKQSKNLSGIRKQSDVFNRDVSKSGGERTLKMQSVVDTDKETELESERTLKKQRKTLNSSQNFSQVGTLRKDGNAFLTKPSTSRSRDLLKNQKSINDFFKTNKILSASQVLSDQKKMEEFNEKLKLIKDQELASMKISQEIKTKVSPVKKKGIGFGKGTKVTQKIRLPKQVNRAFLVNGKVYKPPRLTRPKYWVTDRLYNYLWKHLEPKYKLESRVISEKFIHKLTQVTNFILKQKAYEGYKVQLHALIKEMARLGIIRNRNDFYNFCYDFLPYDIRVKTTPMLLPGNKKNIPYDANKLLEPLLDS